MSTDQLTPVERAPPGHVRRPPLHPPEASSASNDPVPQSGRITRHHFGFRGDTRPPDGTTAIPPAEHVAASMTHRARCVARSGTPVAGALDTADAGGLRNAHLVPQSSDCHRHFRPLALLRRTAGSRPGRPSRHHGRHDGRGDTPVPRALLTTRAAKIKRPRRLSGRGRPSAVRHIWRLGTT